MIINRMNELNSRKLILASSSPRRKEILEKLGVKIEVLPSTYEETLNPAHFSHPSDFVKETAEEKAKEVVNRIKACGKHADLIISADTCVTLDEKVFGKPKDEVDAIIMLNKLSGRIHEVITGVCMMYKYSSMWQKIAFHETTSVTFASLNNALIKAYVDTKEPLDKAGAYGIQGIGGALIQAINGDYYNVMGFPLHRFASHATSILDHWAEEK